MILFPPTHSSQWNAESRMGDPIPHLRALPSSFYPPPPFVTTYKLPKCFIMSTSEARQKYLTKISTSMQAATLAPWCQQLHQHCHKQQQQQQSNTQNKKSTTIITSNNSSSNCRSTKASLAPPPEQQQDHHYRKQQQQKQQQQLQQHQR